MTGNVAQVFLTDDEWASTLLAVRAALRPAGWFAFEVRDPARAAWREWTRERSFRRVDLPDVGPVRTWVELTRVALPLVSFRWSFEFEADGATLHSDSTIRFRPRTSSRPRSAEPASSCTTSGAHPTVQAASSCSSRGPHRSGSPPSGRRHRLRGRAALRVGSLKPDVCGADMRLQRTPGAGVAWPG